MQIKKHMKKISEWNFNSLEDVRCKTQTMESKQNAESSNPIQLQLYPIN